MGCEGCLGSVSSRGREGLGGFKCFESVRMKAFRMTVHLMYCPHVLYRIRENEKGHAVYSVTL